MFDALVVPKILQKHILHESHSSCGHNGTTRLYQFIKCDIIRKDWEEVAQNLMRHCLQCEGMICKQLIIPKFI